MGKKIMWSWILKLVSGWLPTSGEKTGKLLWVIGIVIMVLFSTNLYERVMDKLFPKQPSIINVQGDYNAEQKDVMNFGCSAWRGYLKIGIKSK